MGQLAKTLGAVAISGAAILFVGVDDTYAQSAPTPTIADALSLPIDQVAKYHNRVTRTFVEEECRLIDPQTAKCDVYLKSMDSVLKFHTLDTYSVASGSLSVQSELGSGEKWSEVPSKAAGFFKTATPDFVLDASSPLAQMADDTHILQNNVGVITAGQHMMVEICSVLPVSADRALSLCYQYKRETKEVTMSSVPMAAWNGTVVSAQNVARAHRSYDVQYDLARYDTLRDRVDANKGQPTILVR